MTLKLHRVIDMDAKIAIQFAPMTAPLQWVLNLSKDPRRHAVFSTHAS